ncbi:GntR family transcriptional regulator [Mucilaginibacter arboris]|uniref:GntR family transcriptional regulator n=1 Tax=Mucilaginibacter arboris TaxID=2682090 RepID=A0A7K1SU14_9SPHI|nr:GntR family transcriptional regulator [Mucilaginibacter arboris]MVN20822.1 GntR family transcriptional regulator [Mucilaginibacter arboris]
MKPIKFFSFIKVDEYSATPKYLQLTNSILTAIETGKIQKDDLLPSINELSYELEISRDTAEKGYKYLKKLGVLGSIPGKGYYIISTDFRQTLKICLLFNKLSSHKKIIYDSFIAAIGENVAIDFYIYNNDFSLFKKLVTNKKDQYSHFVIIPHFIEGGENAHEVINLIPKEKLVLLDKKIPGVNGEYAAVYENFEKDIYVSLDQAREQLSKYNTIKLIFPKDSYFPKEIIKGFSRFCQQYAFTHKVISCLTEEELQEGVAYINLMENDLVVLIEKIISSNFEIGKQIGVISYNEIPLKKIILNGITTISTDFKEMGTLAAQLILENSPRHVEVPFTLTLRNSL